MFKDNITKETFGVWVVLTGPVGNPELYVVPNP